MKTKIEISFGDYNKLCDMAIAKGKSVEDTLIDLLEIAGKYDISKVTINKTPKKVKKLA